MHSNLKGEIVHSGARTTRVHMLIGAQGLEGEHLAPGEEYSLPEPFAAELIANNWARKVTPKVTPTPVPTDPEKIEDQTPPVVKRDPVPETRDPKPKARGR